MEMRNNLEEIFTKSGFNEFKWIDTKEIVVAPWVRMKCQFGCPSYGKSASCPPNTPSTVECRAFFNSYSQAVIFKFNLSLKHPEERHNVTWEINKRLLEVERAVFLSGYHKVFLLFMGSCAACSECTPNREDCKKPKIARPLSEGMSVDVFETVRKVGYEIKVLKDYNEEMNRFAFLLVE